MACAIRYLASASPDFLRELTDFICESPSFAYAECHETSAVIRKGAANLDDVVKSSPRTIIPDSLMPQAYHPAAAELLPSRTLGTGNEVWYDPQYAKWLIHAIE